MTRNPLPRCWHLWARGRRWRPYHQLALGGGRTWWRVQCPNCTRRPVAVADDKCRISPNGSVSHKWACGFDETCPASSLPPHPNAGVDRSYDNT